MPTAVNMKKLRPTTIKRWQGWLEDWDRSGLTIVQWCRKSGVSLVQFRLARRTLNRLNGNWTPPPEVRKPRSIFEATELSKRVPACRSFAQDFEPAKPCQPTDARPGSEDKLAELAARLERGESLWHDEDADIFEHPEDYYDCFRHPDLSRAANKGAA